MKYIQFYLLILLLGCNAPRQMQPCNFTQDSLRITSRLNAEIVELKNDRDEALRQSVYVSKMDTLFADKHLIDSLKQEIVLRGFAIRRAKFYIHLCQKNPINLRFLISWSTRALNIY